jgi:hypothetical protein
VACHINYGSIVRERSSIRLRQGFRLRCAMARQDGGKRVMSPGARRKDIYGSSAILMGKGKCRGAIEEISQTRQCLVSRQTNSCVLKGRWISPFPPGRFHFCHQYPVPCAGLISSVAPRPPKGTASMNLGELRASRLTRRGNNDSFSLGGEDTL